MLPFLNKQRCSVAVSVLQNPLGEIYSDERRELNDSIFRTQLPRSLVDRYLLIASFVRTVAKWFFEVVCCCEDAEASTLQCLGRMERSIEELEVRA